MFKTPADGYTIFVAHPQISSHQAIQGFDKTYKDFTPIASFAELTPDQVYGLWAPPSTPQYIVEFLEHATAKACEEDGLNIWIESSGAKSVFRNSQEYLEFLNMAVSEAE